jgi:hypothetical protein
MLSFISSNISRNKFISISFKETRARNSAGTAPSSNPKLSNAKAGYECLFVGLANVAELRSFNSYRHRREATNKRYAHTTIASSFNEISAIVLWVVRLKTGLMDTSPPKKN